MAHTAIVRGLGDIGSAVAHRLFLAGYAVVIHDVPQPTTTRRQMAFADAAFDGAATLESVEARRVDDIRAIPSVIGDRVVAVYLGPFAPLVEGFKPYVLVDARMVRCSFPEDQRGLAQMVIGLGPNVCAGETCDAAIVTTWDAPGTILRKGEKPPPVGRHARDRYVYAPCAGVFRTRAAIGDRVTAAQPIAMIDSRMLFAPLAGVLRGLTRDGVPVDVRTEVIEVAPHAYAELSGIGERSRRIADGVIGVLGMSRQV